MRCIFCKQDTAGSRSREHIIPESLGNTTQILPPGVVCDSCNNYLSREVESRFLNSEQVRLLRFEQAIPSKRKRVPTAIAVVNGLFPAVAHHHASGSTKLSLDVPPDAFERIARSTSGSVVLPMLTTLHGLTATSRFLAKVALEAVAQRLLANSPSHESLVEDPGLDPLRNYARRGHPKEWSHHSRRIYDANKRFDGDDGETYQIVHEYDFLPTDGGEVYFVLGLFGFELAINLGGPDVDGYIEWLEQHNDASPLYYGRNAT